MAAQGDDCYFYYYSSCAKGDMCPFRHCPEALGNETVCSLWRQGHCYRPVCSFRHMEIEKNRSAIACYWESQPTGCLKQHCPFLHMKPRNHPPPTAAIAHIPKPLVSSGLPAKVPVVPAPVVEPVVVNPHDQDDNSSVDMSPAKETPLSSWKLRHSPQERPVEVKVDTSLNFGIKTLSQLRETQTSRENKVVQSQIADSGNQRKIISVRNVHQANTIPGVAMGENQRRVASTLRGAACSIPSSNQTGKPPEPQVQHQTSTRIFVKSPQKRKIAHGMDDVDPSVRQRGLEGRIGVAAKRRIAVSNAGVGGVRSLDQIRRGQSAMNEVQGAPVAHTSVKSLDEIRREKARKLDVDNSDMQSMSDIGLESEVPVGERSAGDVRNRLGRMEVTRGGDVKERLGRIEEVKSVVDVRKRLGRVEVGSRGDVRDRLGDLEGEDVAPDDDLEVEGLDDPQREGMDNVDASGEGVQIKTLAEIRKERLAKRREVLKIGKENKLLDSSSSPAPEEREEFEDAGEVKIKSIEEIRRERSAKWGMDGGDVGGEVKIKTLAEIRGERLAKSMKASETYKGNKLLGSNPSEEEHCEFEDVGQVKIMSLEEIRRARLAKFVAATSLPKNVTEKNENAEHVARYAEDGSNLEKVRVNSLTDIRRSRLGRLFAGSDVGEVVDMESSVDDEKNPPTVGQVRIKTLAEIRRERSAEAPTETGTDLREPHSKRLKFDSSHPPNDKVEVKVKSLAEIRGGQLGKRSLVRSIDTREGDLGIKSLRQIRKEGNAAKPESSSSGDEFGIKTLEHIQKETTSSSGLGSDSDGLEITGAGDADVKQLEQLKRERIAKRLGLLGNGKTNPRSESSEVESESMLQETVGQAASSVLQRLGPSAKKRTAGLAADERKILISVGDDGGKSIREIGGRRSKASRVGSDVTESAKDEKAVVKSKKGRRRVTVLTEVIAKGSKKHKIPGGAPDELESGKKTGAEVASSDGVKSRLGAVRKPSIDTKGLERGDEEGEKGEVLKLEDCKEERGTKEEREGSEEPPQKKKILLRRGKERPPRKKRAERQIYQPPAAKFRGRSTQSSTNDEGRLPEPKNETEDVEEDKKAKDDSIHEGSVRPKRPRITFHADDDDNQSMSRGKTKRRGWRSERKDSQEDSFQESRRGETVVQISDDGFQPDFSESLDDIVPPRAPSRKRKGGLTLRERLQQKTQLFGVSSAVDTQEADQTKPGPSPGSEAGGSLGGEKEARRNDWMERVEGPERTVGGNVGEDRVDQLEGGDQHVETVVDDTVEEVDDQEQVVDRIDDSRFEGMMDEDVEKEDTGWNRDRADQDRHIGGEGVAKSMDDDSSVQEKVEKRLSLTGTWEYGALDPTTRGVSTSQEPRSPLDSREEQTVVSSTGNRDEPPEAERAPSIDGEVENVSSTLEVLPTDQEHSLSPDSTNLTIPSSEYPKPRGETKSDSVLGDRGANIPESTKSRQERESSSSERKKRMSTTDDDFEGLLDDVDDLEVAFDDDDDALLDEIEDLINA